MTEYRELQNEIRNLAIAVHELSTQVHALAERVERLEDTALSRTEWLAYRNGEERARGTVRLVAPWVAVVVSIAGLLTTALNVLLSVLRG